MKKTILLSVISSFFILTFLYAAGSDDLKGSNTGWKAGVARVVITPEQSMWMAGYGGGDHSSEGTIHDLWAKATASLSDAIILFDKAEHYKVPIFSSSSLRFMENAQSITQGKVGKVLGAFTYSPASIEKTHPDLFWYGIHGVEALYTVMDTGCKSVVRVHTEGTDVAV